MTTSAPRLTQRDIARLAGVSQATVSFVLNGRADASARIGPETRDRVIKVIRDTGYVADPIARRMAQKRNRILGVFTSEAVFPRAQADFYTPFLFGIEEAAETRGYDLLLFTGAPARETPRRIFHQNHRLRLADGCVLLGRNLAADELEKLVASRYPFVAIGRRDDAGGRVPYVGANYADATGHLVGRAARFGHRRVAFVGPGPIAESSADRLRGFARAAATYRLFTAHEATAGRDAADILASLLLFGATAAFVEDPDVVCALIATAAEGGIRVPDDLSVVALITPTRQPEDAPALTSFHIPREEMGRQAVALLADMLEGKPGDSQRLLTCKPIEGQTLGDAPAHPAILRPRMTPALEGIPT